MVLTILEAQVKPEYWEKLESIYKEKTRNVPQEIVQTYLVQSSSDRSIWRILTFWLSREALEAMRKASTPEGVLMFRSVSAEPALSVFEVKESAQKFAEEKVPDY